MTPPSRRADDRDAEASAELARATEKIEAVARFAGGVAHDFNNLLTVISGNAQHLLSEVAPGRPVRPELAEIVEAATRATTLTQQLLAFSRQQVLHPRAVALSSLLSALWPVLEATAGDGVKLQRIVGPRSGTVLVDAAQIEQSLVHLVRNAREAMREDGVISIEVRDLDVDDVFAAAHRPMAPGSFVLLRVTDAGAGMDDATLARMFEPFFTTKERKHGAGMGLAAVYGTVKQSGGYIWAESAPGNGTTVSLFFPRITTPSGGQVRTARTIARPPAARPVVLIAEDEALVRALARRTLERAGYIVHEAPNAHEALRVARELGGTLDLLLTDIVMPGMSGRELANVIERELPDVQIVLMSGYAYERDAHVVLSGGRWRFLQKPFSLDDLRDQIKDALLPRS